LDLLENYPGALIVPTLVITEIAEEPHLGFGSEPSGGQIGDLGDDKCGHDECAGVVLEKVQARFVVLVVGVEIGVKRASVNDDANDCRPISLRRISSIRSEMSLRPLRPDPAAISRLRGPPRYASIASRVSSEMVMPRRAAS
jgi:hypothetical protein